MRFFRILNIRCFSADQFFQIFLIVQLNCCGCHCERGRVILNLRIKKYPNGNVRQIHARWSMRTEGNVNLTLTGCNTFVPALQGGHRNADATSYGLLRNVAVK